VSSTPENPSTDGESATEEQPNGDPQSDEDDKDLDEFDQWLESEGPQSANARTVLLEAARILDDQGQITISSSLREEFGLEQGTKLMVVPTEYGLVLKKVDRAETVDISPEDVSRLVHEARSDDE